MALVRSIITDGFGSPPASGGAINTPAITVTNNGDGTATVAISNSTGGTTNTVYYVPIDNQWGDALTWTNGGNRTGNGNVTVTTGRGVFWFYVASTDGSNSMASNIAQKWISTSVESVWNQILDAVQARVRALNLTGISSSRVIVLTQLDAEKVREVNDSTGGVVIAPAGAETYPDGGPTTKDRILYPVVVAGIVVANMDSGRTNAQMRTFRETWLLHRQRIRQSLHMQGLVTPEQTVVTARARPLPAIDDRAWKAMNLLSPLLIEFESREQRGIV